MERRRNSQQQTWDGDERRSGAGSPYQGDERRTPDLIENPPGRNPGISTEPYAGEMPRDPTPGDPGAEARDRDAVERGRESERELSKAPKKLG